MTEKLLTGTLSLNTTNQPTIVLRTGKKTEKLYNQQRIQLQHFDLFFAGRSICNCPAVNILITCREIIQFWKAYFLYAFCFDWWSVANWSPTSHRTVAISQRTFANKLQAYRHIYRSELPISCRSIADKLQNLSQVNQRSYHNSRYGHKMVAVVSGIANQSQWYLLQKGCTTVALSVWPMLWFRNNWIVFVLLAF